MLALICVPKAGIGRHLDFYNRRRPHARRNILHPTTFKVRSLNEIRGHRWRPARGFPPPQEVYLRDAENCLYQPSQLSELSTEEAEGSVSAKYEAKIAALERKVGQLNMELDLLPIDGGPGRSARCPAHRADRSHPRRIAWLRIPARDAWAAPPRATPSACIRHSATGYQTSSRINWSS